MMFFFDICIFAASLGLVMHGASQATRHAVLVARSFNLSRYTVGFLVVAVISILPETFISLNALAGGIPEFGLGTLLGSNVADLTLVFALTTFVAARGLKVESRILEHHRAYPWILIIPLILGFDGNFSRLDGLALLTVGAIFYYLAFKGGRGDVAVSAPSREVFPAVGRLFLYMVVLLVGAHFTVSSAASIATYLDMSPVLIGMFVVGLGTTIPELFFSIKSTHHSHDDALAVGDVLGTVLADATIVIGILALLSPFSFPVTIIYIAGAFMVAGAFILFNFMRSGHLLTRREGIVLVVFWLLFVAVEFIVHHGGG